MTHHKRHPLFSCHHFDSNMSNFIIEIQFHSCNNRQLHCTVDHHFIQLVCGLSVCSVFILLSTKKKYTKSTCTFMYRGCAYLRQRKRSSVSKFYRFKNSIEIPHKQPQLNHSMKCYYNGCLQSESEKSFGYGVSECVCVLRCSCCHYSKNSKRCQTKRKCRFLSTVNYATEHSENCMCMFMFMQVQVDPHATCTLHTIPTETTRKF